MSTGIRIKMRREHLGLTQSQLADLLGTTKSCVSHWETEYTAVKSADLPAIAKALRTSVARLVA